MFNIPRYLASHPIRLAKKIKAWAKKIEDQQHREDVDRKIAERVGGYLWKNPVPEHPNCRCMPPQIPTTFEVGDYVYVTNPSAFSKPHPAIIKHKLWNGLLEVVFEPGGDGTYRTGETIVIHSSVLKRRVKS